MLNFRRYHQTICPKVGLPQEKLIALRQCIEKIGINKTAAQINLNIYVVPAGNLKTARELKVSV